MTADPKPEPRIVDRGAMKRKLLLDPVCRACGVRACNCHHLIGKGQGGDDVEDNLIPLCGSGSDGCHGALHGSPYMRAGRRWEAQDVRRAIGLGLRPSEYHYVLVKLARPPSGSLAALAAQERTPPGEVPQVDFEPGRQFLREQYHAELAGGRMREWAPF